jgi:hypothetical protein
MSTYCNMGVLCANICNITVYVNDFLTQNFNSKRTLPHSHYDLNELLSGPSQKIMVGMESHIFIFSQNVFQLFLFVLKNER